MTLPGRVATAVIGAGHAGLTMSWFLTQAGRDHVVLERQSRAGGSWRERWDNFRLVTPNWTASFPGYRYDRADPDGFMTRDEVDARVARYAASIAAPVEPGTEVRRLAARRGGGFELETPQGSLTAADVVIATGSFHVPRIPTIASELPARVTQLHSHAYRNAQSLPPGAVLIVGSGQSGCQIAEELAEAGRQVYLSVGSAGRAPRRYPRPRHLSLAGDVGRARSRVRRPVPDRRAVARPSAPVGGQPAAVRAQGRPRCQPSPDGTGGDDPAPPDRAQ